MAMSNEPALCELEREDFNINLILKNQKTKSEVDKQQIQLVSMDKDYSLIQDDIDKLEEEIEKLKKEKDDYTEKVSKKGADYNDPEDIPIKNKINFKRYKF